MALSWNAQSIVGTNQVDFTGLTADAVELKFQGVSCSAAASATLYFTTDGTTWVGPVSLPGSIGNGNNHVVQDSWASFTNLTQGLLSGIACPFMDHDSRNPTPAQDSGSSTTLTHALIQYNAGTPSSALPITGVRVHLSSNGSAGVVALGS